MEHYRTIYCFKIVNGLTQNCGLNWRYSDLAGININTIKCKKYVNSARMQTFQYMGPRLYNSLPQYLRQYDGNYVNWKQEFDTFLADIPDHPVTMETDSGLCDPFTARPTNTLLCWIPHLGINRRRVVEPP